jgi:hypothetical protein
MPNVPVAAWTALSAAVFMLLTSALAAPGHADDRPTRRADGVVLTGLDRHRGCPGGYQVAHQHAELAGPAQGEPHDQAAADCSHGPDRAPAGIDVRDRPSTADLHAREAATGTGDAATTAADGSAVPCYGDGVSGSRLQAVYTVAADRPDRYAAVLELLRGYAAGADQAFAASAARDGGVRHLRWVTDSSCALAVAKVVLSPAGDDSLSATRAELAARGYNRTDRKYVVWADDTTYCGIAYVAGDARPDATNPANKGPTYARIDSACWGGAASVAAHEIAHMLGAVNLSAPHSNGAWHCTDEYDRLCYDDGSAVALTYLCASSQEPLLDCNGDDYFNVAPPAGSWLATHWNLASSDFLETVAPQSSVVPPPGATPAPAPTSTTSTTTATPAPMPTTFPTVTVPPAATRLWTTTHRQGRLTARHRQRTVRVDGLAGALALRLAVRRADRLHVRLTGPGGRVLADRWLRSGAVLHRSVAAGPARVEVRGRAGARLSLRVGRWTAA